MKALFRLFLALALASTGSLFGQGSPVRRGQAASYSTHDATVLSMMGWGTGLALGIGLLCCLVNDSVAESGSSSGGGSSGGQTHGGTTH